MEERGMQRAVGKAAGDERVFIPGQGSDWQMRAGSDVITRRAVRAVTGPPTPDRVIHMYLDSSNIRFFSPSSSYGRQPELLLL